MDNEERQVSRVASPSRQTHAGQTRLRVPCAVRIRSPSDPLERQTVPRRRRPGAPARQEKHKRVDVTTSPYKHCGTKWPRSAPQTTSSGGGIRSRRRGQCVIAPAVRKAAGTQMRICTHANAQTHLLPPPPAQRTPCAAAPAPPAADMCPCRCHPRRRAPWAPAAAAARPAGRHLPAAAQRHPPAAAARTPPGAR